MENMLHKLLDAVDDHWHQLADHLDDLDKISTGTDSEQAELAGAVLFHLGDLESSLAYALNVPKRFDPTDGSEYSTTLVNHAINKYIPETTAAILINPTLGLSVNIDSNLHELIQRVIEFRITSGAYQSALKMAVECHRPQLLIKCMKSLHSFLQSPESKGLEPDDTDFPTLADFINYFLVLIQIEETPNAYKHLVVHQILETWKSLETPNWITFADCLVYLQDHDKLASLIDTLSLYETSTPASIAAAFQICFDLVNTTHSHFRTLVASKLHVSLSRIVPEVGLSPVSPLESSTEENVDAIEDVTEPEEGVVHEEEDSSETSESTSIVKTADTQSEPESILQREKSPLEIRLLQLEAVISGEFSTLLLLKFLFERNTTDVELLSFLKNKVSTRDLIGHAASLVTHGFLQCGTSCDDFLRNHKKRLKRTQLWAKMSCIASIGVIHKNHLDEALTVLKPYLVAQEGVKQNPYEMAGGLFAYGLIHSRYSPPSAIEFASTALRNSISSVVGPDANLDQEDILMKEGVIQHGACLGLGLCSLGSNNSSTFTLLNSVLGFDSPISGEAAAIGIGLNSVGSGDFHLLQDLVSICRETKHDRVKRGVALAIGLISFSQQHEIFEFANDLLNDEDDHFLRLAGVYAMALGFCGTQSIQACSKIMARAVSDVNSDVRRKAATLMAFVMFRDLDKVTTLSELLCESYHPHVRYGGAMALGFACVATGNTKALSLIEPMFEDAEDYVRQAALIATALILLQQKPDRILAFHERLIKLISGKHTHRLTKLGAIYALGILYSGGQHVTISLTSPNGLVNILSIVGLFIFNHFWEWHPLSHFLSLAFEPSSGIFLSEKLRIPKLSLRSDAPKSEFSITEKIKKTIESAKPKSTALKAELSTTKKVRAIREAKKRAARGEDEEVSTTGTGLGTSVSSSSVSDVITKSESKSPDSDSTTTTSKSTLKVQEEEEEEKFQILQNPCRITNQQWAKISILDSATWSSLDVQNSFSYDSRKSQISIVFPSTTDLTNEDSFVEIRKPFVPSTDDPYAMEPLPPSPFTLL